MEIIQSDIELFLANYIRDRIDGDLIAKYPVMAGFEVTNREPSEDSKDFPPKLIVVRDDGTDAGDIHTGLTSVGISVLMGSPTNLADPSLAARIVHAIVRDCARVETGNPVAAVTQSKGPYAVTESQPRARLYSTHELATVGASL